MPFGENQFKYNGISSETYGLYFAYMDGSFDEDTQIELDPSYEISVSNTSKRGRIVSRIHKETFEFDVEIFSLSAISRSKEREIMNWLLNSTTFKKLEILSSDSEYENVYYNCIFTTAERYYGEDGISGWKMHVITDAPYAWENPTSVSFSSSNFTVNNASDERDFTYPKVEVHVGTTGGTIKITNNTINEYIQFDDLIGNDILYINEWGQISGTKNSNLYSTMSGKIIRLIPGSNEYTCTGNITQIKFIYNNARRVGK